MENSMQEHIVMTPRKKAPGLTALLVERKRTTETQGAATHVAGGDHRGLVINKMAATEELPPPHLALEFRVFLVSAQTGKHCTESRTLRFWFNVAESEENVHASIAQDFFKLLVSPNDFPRDYVGFIKRVMKLMQHGFPGLEKVEVELKQLGESEEPPERPQSADEGGHGRRVELSEDRLLEVIEASYPNPVTVPDLVRDQGWEEEAVAAMLLSLQERGLVSSLDQPGAFTRAAHGDAEVQVVRSMPSVVSSKQPTIAVITALYCEKLAVDAMMDDTETYVKYTTVGESNVYTLGTVGCHRVVTTKLPTSGHTMGAMIAAGNTTTRLLGTFQKVDYVFLVGVGGAVPHYTDYSKHVRLGDVVVSHPGTPPKDYVYVYCETANSKNDKLEFETKRWCPPNLGLQSLAERLREQGEEEGKCDWLEHLKNGQSDLTNQSELETDFSRPSAVTDKLFMSIGARDVIEVAHPSPAEGALPRQDGCPRIHLGPVASGVLVSKDEATRQAFSSRFGCLAFDPELHAVVEGVQGNCRDSFIAVRGISDYRDGSRRSEWQPYAALAAASVMKSLICAMGPPQM